MALPPEPKPAAADADISAIIDWIQKHALGSTSRREISPDTLLLDENLLDSLHVVELSLFLEDLTGTSLSPEEITPENLATPRSIAALVGRLRSSGGTD
jgi:acyl carrier protein